MYRVVSTIEAENDLKRAAAYIRRDSPSASRRWVKQMRAHIQSLATHPERCPFAPEAELFGRPIRHLLCGSGNRGTYRVLFTITDEFVAVFHIRHGSMLPLSPN